MRSVAGLVCLALAFVSSTAFAQTGTAPSAGAKPGQPGIDVYSTIYPRPPSPDVVQSTANLPVQPTDPTTPYPPVGIASDNLIWYPSVTGGAFFDDNVFASNSNRQSDWAGFVRPELGWRTNNWANMEAAGTAFVEQRWYDKFSSEDQFNAGAAVGGTLRPGENTQVVTRLQYLHAHEARGTSESVNATFARPLRYDQLEGAGAINQRYGRMWTSVGAAAAFIQFADGDIAGAPVSQDYRNGVIARVPARFGYVVAPLTSVFVEVAANRRDFRVSDFDSRGYRVVGGMLFEPGPGSRVKGEFFAGYMNQKYNGVGFPDRLDLDHRQRDGVSAAAESHRDAGSAARRARDIVERRPVPRPGRRRERDRDRRGGPARLGDPAESGGRARASPISRTSISASAAPTGSGARWRRCGTSPTAG